MKNYRTTQYDSVITCIIEYPKRSVHTEYNFGTKARASAFLRAHGCRRLRKGDYYWSAPNDAFYEDFLALPARVTAPTLKPGESLSDYPEYLAYQKAMGFPPYG
jgi:hypothetical protein